MTPAELQAIREEVDSALSWIDEDGDWMDRSWLGANICRKVPALLAEVDRLRAWIQKQRRDHGDMCAWLYDRAKPCNCGNADDNFEIDELLGKR